MVLVTQSFPIAFFSQTGMFKLPPDPQSN